jgi:hypothetical protein
VSPEDPQALLDEILPVLVDVSIADEDVGAKLRGGVGMQRLRAAVVAARPGLPRDHGHLAMMDDSYTTCASSPASAGRDRLPRRQRH